MQFVSTNSPAPTEPRNIENGNRNFDEANTTTLPKNCVNGATPVVCTADVPRVNPSVNTANNRLDGYTFDGAGNTTIDADGREFTYDAENKQVKVRDPLGQTIGEYFYDGDGKRVKKVVPNGETTVFVYDAAGKLVAEYSTVVAPQQDAKVAYLTNDHLGSPRINTDQNGNITARHDYHPFGEEIVRAAYGGDSVRKQFTGYERDNEVNLDYAINRYYNGSHGRFTSVDPYNIIFEMEKGRDAEEKQQIFVGYISEPQLWNKYVYSINNPLNLSDPDGRRPLTQQEIDNLKKFIQSGIDYANNEISDANERQAFINAVNVAANAIQSAILAVPNDAKEDPKNLRAVLYAMGQIGDSNNVAKWSSGGSVGFNSNGANVTLGAGSNKCTIFVGVAYAKGANIGWNNNGNTGGYQVNWSWRGNVYTPVANDLVTSGATNFEAVANPQLGDIAAGHGTLQNAGWFSNTYHQGHAGIVVAGEVVISANPTHGVRVGRFSPTSDSNAGFKYLRLKP